jgi:hypothetical protein
MTFQRTDDAARGVLVLDAPPRVRLRPVASITTPVKTPNATETMFQFERLIKAD